ncbi:MULTISPECIES: hypothetical protein [unclassified Sphingobium]|jgi:hypothetical protein|uniref:hypothetical protein n=1 Tax=unclassified Sphingobium TaxID=2611147 RepID=UPI000C9FA87F|nr:MULTISPECIES: hypothetical protein [unclassified Sphingobium]PNQ03428.1 hypothetical protein A8G00_11305 [Sphingobium sp. SA916]WDA35205.1 hypothetical protein PO876_17280 [Sphingobium sp. YC-XJ3]WDA37259.1 hypothetical protein PO876_03380 [Sphingobium sp. YC-XJ3]WDA38826.1 hypothetical protein PO876_11930 [Sphingobium sp. YC-XJ3]
MTYPFDQISALGKTNGQFATSLAQIARESGEAYAQIGSKAATAMFDQFKELKPGKAPVFRSEPVTGFFDAIEKSREESVAKIKAAFDAWQAGCQEVFAQAGTGQQAFAETVTAWFQPQAKAPAASAKASGDAAPAPRASVKSGDAG